jgi:hypothetical protein
MHNSRTSKVFLKTTVVRASLLALKATVVRASLLALKNIKDRYLIFYETTSWKLVEHFCIFR